MTYLRLLLPAALAAGLAGAGAAPGVAQDGSQDARGRAPVERMAPVEDAQEIRRRVEEQGYRRVVIVDSEPPFGRALGCHDGTDYALTLDDDGVVADRSRIGPCGEEASTRVRAPFTEVETGKGRDVHVRAPFTDVQVDDKGVRVRAPFVDLNIPRR